ncbi:MAG: hypothetical protein JXA54_17260 [Candidatus Heimdallarchaeota archaeon]|nr:hypothetical protein [Candidatus Heimdallarchaeota archaeon]
MKKNTKVSLVFSLVFFIILGSYLSFHTTNIIGDYDPTKNYISFKIIEANYGDYDQDTYEDDVIVKAVFRSNFIGPVLTFLYFDLVLPSGITFSYSFQVTLISTGSQILITITSYNTATEAGWYTTKITGFFICDDYLSTRTSSFTFDPPTENGPGEPGINLTITY